MGGINHTCSTQKVKLKIKSDFDNKEKGVMIVNNMNL